MAQDPQAESRDAAADQEEESGGQAPEAGEETTDHARETDGEGGVTDTLVQELKNAVREAAMEVLRPAARQATTSAAKYAVSKGPELVTKNVVPAVAERGGAGGIVKDAVSKGGEALSERGGIKGLAGKLMSKLGGGKGGGEATGWGRKRRMPVQQDAWVSVPVKRAYTGWTEYKRWPEYMHRANQVDADIDDEKARVKVTEKMWGFTRPFTAEIVSQKPYESIKWQSREGTKHTGVINFHEVGPRLTLMEVNLDHSPSGLVEKFARGNRFVKRAVRADFHRFKAWIEMVDDEEIEGWLGTIEEGQIVKSHEEALDEEQREEGEGEGGEPEAEEEPEAGAEPETEEEEPEEEEQVEPEEEEEPAAEEEEQYEPEAGEAEGEEEEPEAEEEEQAEEEETVPPRRQPRARRSTRQPRRRSGG